LEIQAEGPYNWSIGIRQNAQIKKSKVTCLLPRRGGNYYATAKVAGKAIRGFLETDDFDSKKNHIPATIREAPSSDSHVIRQNLNNDA
jgi:hypothetical protein